MPRARWSESPTVDGIVNIELRRWAYFDDYIREEMLDYRNYIWRGQAAAKWLLESTLDRLLRRRGKLHDAEVREQHLRRFVLSARGRRGINPPAIGSDNDWWALGQHYGLATPLLDWTVSPYVAAYFAFLDENNDGDDRRAVFGLSRTAVQRKSEEIRFRWGKRKGQPDVVELVEPLSDENTRLVNQSGLFTRAPDGINIDAWVRDKFAGVKDFVRILKITIPDRDRLVALRSLNRMNINHLSLFPDLGGASTFANLDLLIDEY